MSAHEAGPALDRLVAEKVMGWKERRPFWFIATGAPGIGRKVGGDGFDAEHRFAPSTNIAHAWEVVEAFDTHRLQRLWDGKRFWFEADLTNFKRDKFGWSRANSAPLAICLAALDSAAP